MGAAVIVISCVSATVVLLFVIELRMWMNERDFGGFHDNKNNTQLSPSEAILFQQSNAQECWFSILTVLAVLVHGSLGYMAWSVAVLRSWLYYLFCSVVQALVTIFHRRRPREGLRVLFASALYLLRLLLAILHFGPSYILSAGILYGIPWLLCDAVDVEKTFSKLRLDGKGFSPAPPSLNAMAGYCGCMLLFQLVLSVNILVAGKYWESDRFPIFWAGRLRQKVLINGCHMLAYMTFAGSLASKVYAHWSKFIILYHHSWPSSKVSSSPDYEVEEFLRQLQPGKTLSHRVVTIGWVLLVLPVLWNRLHFWQKKKYKSMY